MTTQISITDPNCDCVQVIDSDTDEVVEILIPGPRGPSGSSIAPTLTVTEDYTFLATDQFVAVNSTMPVTLTLPDATVNAGKIYVVHMISTGVVTVAPPMGQTISGSSNLIISHQWDSASLIASGGNWLIW
jgi:hypothetical protein